MSRVVKQCVDKFLEDHDVVLSPWQYEAMLGIMSDKKIYRLVAPHQCGKTFLFELIELFIKERSHHVKSEITDEENFNNLRTGPDSGSLFGHNGM